MNSYIVMQGHTYDEEFELGVIWSPQQDSGGTIPHSWRRMTEVQEGDRVFHYVKGYIVAISLAVSSCRKANKPSNMANQEQWNDEGYLVDLKYHEFEKPLRVRSNLEEIRPFLPVKYSPFQQNGNGNQGYLYPCNEELTIKLLELISEQNICEASNTSQELDIFEDRKFNLFDSVIAVTEAETKAKVRIGQQQFRNNLLQLWGYTCAICQIDLPLLLRASHAIPWKDGSDEERVDPYNGILLCCNHDELYDKGFITFDQQGKLHISSEIAVSDYEKYGLEPQLTIQISEENKRYFQWHKREIYRS